MFKSMPCLTENCYPSDKELSEPLECAHWECTECGQVICNPGHIGGEHKWVWVADALTAAYCEGDSYLN